MKCVLLFFFILTYSIALHAQSVIVRDSSFTGYTPSMSAPAIVKTDYTYNSDCLLSATSAISLYSSGSNVFKNYSYYPNKQLYQLTEQRYSTSTNTLTYDLRTTYTYDKNGITTGTLAEAQKMPGAVYIKSSLDSSMYDSKNRVVKAIAIKWDTSTKKITSHTLDSNLYDANNRLIKTYSYQWNARGVQQLYFQKSFANNGDGTVDTVATIDYTRVAAGVRGGIKYKYTYSDAARKNFQILSYTYNQRNAIINSTSTTQRHDSANYVSRDTLYNVINGVAQPTVYTTKIYNTNGTLYSIQTRTHNIPPRTCVDCTPVDVVNTVRYYYGPCSSVLPLSFVGFSASYQENSARLQWQTANEINAASFSVQRSIDGEHFTTIGRVTATGTGSHSSYRYTDVNAFTLTAATIYYRLAETDKDGTVHYSAIKPLDVIPGKTAVFISPNPVTGTITLYAASTIIQARITITDMKGQTIYTATQNIIAGSKTAIDASLLAKGVYIVTIQSPIIRQQVRIIKE